MKRKKNVLKTLRQDGQEFNFEQVEVDEPTRELVPVTLDALDRAEADLEHRCWACDYGFDAPEDPDDEIMQKLW